MKVKKKKSGSVKIEPEILEKAIQYCKDNGILISYFVNQAVKEKLQIK